MKTPFWFDLPRRVRYHNPTRGTTPQSQRQSTRPDCPLACRWPFSGLALFAKQTTFRFTKNGVSRHKIRKNSKNSCFPTMCPSPNRLCFHKHPGIGESSFFKPFVFNNIVALSGIFVARISRPEASRNTQVAFYVEDIIVDITHKNH